MSNGSTFLAKLAGLHHQEEQLREKALDLVPRRSADPTENINARRAMLNRVMPILPNLPGLSSSELDAEFAGGLPDRQGRE